MVQMAFCDLLHTVHKQVTNVSQHVFVILLWGILMFPLRKASVVQVNSELTIRMPYKPLLQAWDFGLYSMIHISMSCFVCKSCKSGAEIFYCRVSEARLQAILKKNFCFRCSGRVVHKMDNIFLPKKKKIKEKKKKRPPYWLQKRTPAGPETEVFFRAAS